MMHMLMKIGVMSITYLHDLKSPCLDLVHVLMSLCVYLVYMSISLCIYINHVFT
jgi:hypothetical protein